MYDGFSKTYKNRRDSFGIACGFLFLCCKKGRNDKTSLTTNRITKK